MQQTNPTSWHVTSEQRRIDFDVSRWRRIDVETTLFQRSAIEDLEMYGYRP